MKILPALCASAMCLLSPSVVSADSSVESSCPQSIHAGQYELAISACETAASAGDAEAQFWRGMLEPDAEWEIGDAWLRKSAAQGFAPAIYELAQSMQRSGKGRKPDRAQALKLIEDAAEKGYVPAQVALGSGLMQGRWGFSDAERARHWLHKASEAGSSEAMRFMAQSYPSPHGHTGESSSPDDDRQAADWLLKAAQHGNERAQYHLALAYMNGDRFRKDPIEGFAWLLVAATAGNSEIEESRNTAALHISARDQALAEQRVKALRAELVAPTPGLEHPVIPERAKNAARRDLVPFAVESGQRAMVRAAQVANTRDSGVYVELELIGAQANPRAEVRFVHTINVTQGQNIVMKSCDVPEGGEFDKLIASFTPLPRDGETGWRGLVIRCSGQTLGALLRENPAYMSGPSRRDRVQRNFAMAEMKPGFVFMMGWMPIRLDDLSDDVNAHARFLAALDPNKSLPREQIADAPSAPNASEDPLKKFFSEEPQGEPVTVAPGATIAKRASRTHENVDLRSLGSEQCIGYADDGTFGLRPRTAEEAAEYAAINPRFGTLRCRVHIDGKAILPHSEAVVLLSSPKIVDVADGTDRKLVAYDGDAVKWEYVMSPRDGKVVWAPEVYRVQPDMIVAEIDYQLHFIDTNTGSAQITRQLPNVNKQLYVVTRDRKRVFMFLERGTRQTPDKSGIYVTDIEDCRCVKHVADIDKKRYSLTELRLTADERYLVVSYKRMVGGGYGIVVVDVGAGGVAFTEEWEGSGKVEEIVSDQAGRFGIYAVAYTYGKTTRGKRRDEIMTDYAYE